MEHGASAKIMTPSPLIQPTQALETDTGPALHEVSPKVQLMGTQVLTDHAMQLPLQYLHKSKWSG
jgi:hypothetical protein